MGQVQSPKPVKLFVGMLAARAEWLDRAAERLAARYGEVDLVSGTLPFSFTRYYEHEMGANLLRRFVSFRELIAPDRLPTIKRQANDLEQELAASLGAAVPRPVNLDPGYLAAGKIVLATTKDYSHRLYLGEGIYGEATLHFLKGRWEPWPWTYPDYRSESYATFFLDLRRRYLEQLKP